MPLNPARSHPKNPWIRNGAAARMLIRLTRCRVPVLSRLYLYFMGCDIGLGLPRTVFLPHPMGIVIHRNTRLGDDVVIGHQVTLGGRDLTNAAPSVFDRRDGRGKCFAGSTARLWYGLGGSPTQP